MAANARKRGKDDGPGNVSEAFAQELKAARESHGYTQEQLAKLIPVHVSVIAKLETCRVMPSPDLAANLDSVLTMPGTFARLRGLMMSARFEPWFRPFVDIEERATMLRWWEPLVIPGLLQTEAYARGMIRAGRPGDSDAEIDHLVAARMTRQAILDRDDPSPPMLSVILGETVLRQRIGDATTMREQLGRLVESAGSLRISIQVMPSGADAHPGMLGPFVIATFDDGPDAAYLDNALTGQVTERRKEVARVALLYDTLRSEALAPGASRELIAKVKQEWT